MGWEKRLTWHDGRRTIVAASFFLFFFFGFFGFFGAGIYIHIYIHAAARGRLVSLAWLGFCALVWPCVVLWLLVWSGLVWSWLGLACVALSCLNC